MMFRRWFRHLVELSYVAHWHYGYYTKDINVETFLILAYVESRLGRINTADWNS